MQSEDSVKLELGEGALDAGNSQLPGEIIALKVVRLEKQLKIVAAVFSWMFFALFLLIVIPADQARTAALAAQAQTAALTSRLEHATFQLNILNNNFKAINKTVEALVHR